MSEMAALTGRHYNSIRRRARLLGLANEEQAKRAVMASGVRHDYFGRIDTPLKAYLLGLLATDGCISSAGNGIRFKIGAKDIELAELMRDEISPHSLIHTYASPPLPGYTKARKVAFPAVSSAQMKADLGSLGIVPRKTFILRWPGLDPHLEASFILGCFDGDGCLQVAGRPFRWRWELYSASDVFLAAARAAICRHTGLELIRGTSKRGLHYLRLNGGQSVDVLDAWLHVGVPGLSRKRLPSGAYVQAEQAADAWRRGAPQRRSLALYSPERLERARQLRAQGHSLKRIADETDISISVVHRRTRDIPVPAAGSPLSLRGRPGRGTLTA